MQAALRVYNEEIASSLPPRRPLEVMARGPLLRLILDSAETVWPVAVPLQRNILNVFASPGDDELPLEEYVAILAELFEESVRTSLWQFVCKAKHQTFLLWEGIVPYCLAEFWALSNLQGTNEPEKRLIGLLHGILSSNGSESQDQHLPGPYYSLADVVEWKYRGFLFKFRHELDRDHHYRRSWFADALFHLLVRRNYKSWCKTFWPDITRFGHITTRIPSAEHFRPSPCTEAVAEDKLIDTSTPKDWEELIGDAATELVPVIPEPLLKLPLVTLLYCLFVPQRMTRDVILWLDRALCKAWY